MRKENPVAMRYLFNASEFVNGVYIYSLKAGSFVQTKKNDFNEITRLTKPLIKGGFYFFK